ncbi:MAG: hypothetical protein HY758_10255 [Nitrospirae bacterium]|nr:hypothetical protein [Nitrospirota bacterium]
MTVNLAEKTKGAVLPHLCSLVYTGLQGLVSLFSRVMAFWEKKMTNILCRFNNPVHINADKIHSRITTFPPGEGSIGV